MRSVMCFPDEEVPLKVGRVELQKPDTIGSSIFGFDPQQESSSDEDSKISTHTKRADDLCPLPVEVCTGVVCIT
jgi:hypothetical protein